MILAYCAQCIAKPKFACALRFSWAATSSSLANMTSSIKPEVHNISLRRQKWTEPRLSVTCTKNLAKIGRVVSEDMVADRQTHTHPDRHAHHNTPLPYRGRSNKTEYCEYAGASSFHAYATNTLSWTCNVKDADNASRKARDHAIAPPDDTRQYPA